MEIALAIIIPLFLFGVLPIAIYVIHALKHKNDPEVEYIVEETEPEPSTPKTQGRIFGTLGMLYMAGYAMYINATISGASVSNLGEAIGKAAAYNAFRPFFYCVLAGALLSFVGLVGKNKTFILLALTATIGSVFMLPGAFEMLIIPAILFIISYIRMAK